MSPSNLNVDVWPVTDTGQVAEQNEDYVLIYQPQDPQVAHFSGDLYVVVNVDAHPLFEREKNDIIYHLSLSFCQVSLGAKVKVPTLEGKIEVRIPPGTQSGEVLRLKEKGIPFSQGAQRGDQQVVVEVKIPSKLTLKQKKLLRQFEKIS